MTTSLIGPASIHENYGMDRLAWNEATTSFGSELTPGGWAFHVTALPNGRCVVWNDADANDCQAQEYSDWDSAVQNGVMDPCEENYLHHHEVDTCEFRETMWSQRSPA